MFNVKNINLPTYFEKDGDIGNDSRFQKVKVYVAHTGENLNNSIFSKEVLEKMSPSLSYIPILGLISDNPKGDKDFRGHEQNVSWDKENNDVKVTFSTHAYGFVGKEHNAHFEIAGGKEWLVCDGYLWTRFDEAMSLFKEANGSKGQSMEVLDGDGYIDDQGRLVWEDGKFAGLCILGDDVPPAMTGSVISTEFSRNDIKASIKQMFAEFSSEKGDNTLAKETKKKVEDEEVTVEDKGSKEKDSKSTKDTPETKESSKSESTDTKSGEETSSEQGTDDNHSSESVEDEHAEMSVEKDKEEKDKETDEPVEDKKDKKDFAKEDTSDEDEEAEDDKASDDDEEDESKDKETFEKEDDKEDEESSEDSSDEDKDEDEEGKKKANFQLTLTQREEAVVRAVEARSGKDCWVYPMEVFENEGILKVVNYEGENRKEAYVKVAYEVNADDTIKITSSVNVVPTYLTNEEVTKLEADRKRIADLEKELTSLKAYQAQTEKEKKQAILEQAREELGEDNFAKLQSQFADITPEELEKEVALTLYKQDKLSGIKSKSTVYARNFNTTLGFGEFDNYFHK